MNTPFIICKKEEWFSSLAIPVDLKCSDPDIAVFVHDDTVWVTIFRNDTMYQQQVKSGLEQELRFHIDKFPVGTFNVAIFGQHDGFLTEVSYVQNIPPQAHTPEPSTFILFMCGLILCAIGSRNKIPYLRGCANGD